MKELVVFVVATVFCVLLAAAISAVGCHGRWRDAGFEGVRFDFPGGCKVKKNGKWIPTSAIRDF